MRLTEKPSDKDTARDELVKRELDAVIGNRYVETTSESEPVRLRRKAKTWLAAAGLAIVAATTLALVLHTHLVQAPVVNAPAKPVVIQILPAGK